MENYLGLLHVGDDHAGLRLVDRTPFQVRLFEHRALQVRDEQLVLGVLKEEVELGIRNLTILLEKTGIFKIKSYHLFIFCFLFSIFNIFNIFNVIYRFLFKLVIFF
jgi:hypothetical protein